jgi:peptidyl-tRNA hydrolase, PTH1 family
MKKIIMGLGNPGKKYENNRHNIGFMVLDNLIGIQNFKYNEATNCEIFEKNGILFIKSHWFMNLSGVALKQFTKKYNMKPDNVIIIHDDVNLDFGLIKTKSEGGSGGHNGLKNIVTSINSDEFLRVRIGVGRNKDIDLINHVLGDFNDEEIKSLKETIIPDVVKILEETLGGKL